MTETRISVWLTESPDGHDMYYPQRKGKWFWHSLLANKSGYTYCETLAEAQAYIDKFLEVERTGRSVIIKYPQVGWQP